MAWMMKLADKDVKITIISSFCMFKKIEENKSMMKWYWKI